MCLKTVRRATGEKNLPFSKHALNTLNFEANHVNRKDFHFQLLSCRRYAMNTQGHPTNVFCKISTRRSKYCLEFSIA